MAYITIFYDNTISNFRQSSLNGGRTLKTIAFFDAKSYDRESLANFRNDELIGTGKIGRCFADICEGFGMNILGFDPYESPEFAGKYVTLDELLEKSDIISLHCPLTRENKHLISDETISKMKKGVYIINTSRGQLIDTQALNNGLKSGKIGAAGLDVYEEETSLFFEDFSDEVITDDTLSTLIAMPNVIVSSHQAFLTKEALSAIAETTVKNFLDYFSGNELKNEISV